MKWQKLSDVVENLLGLLVFVQKLLDAVHPESVAEANALRSLSSQLEAAHATAVAAQGARSSEPPAKAPVPPAVEPDQGLPFDGEPPPMSNT